MINIIYNKTSNNIIGINNNLPVFIKDDLKRFREITTNRGNNVLVMGYNTWLSLDQKPLKDRTNIIISKNNYSNIELSENILKFKSFEECIDFLKNKDYNDVFLIGGGQLYNYVFSNYEESINCIFETITHVNINDKNSSSIVYLENSISDTFEKIKHESNVGSVRLYNKEVIFVDYDYNTYQNKNYINRDEMQYIDLLTNIMNNRVNRDSRNSEVISSFGEKMKFDLRNGFPLLTTKKMGWKTILRELLWFIKGSTDNKELNDKGVHIWDGNASKDFMESRGLDYEENDLGPIYGFQWRHFGDKYIDKDTEYTGGIDQLKYVIDTIKNDPLSRRIILSAWNPVDLDKMALPPCHVMVQFYVDVENKYIDAQLYQRSGDMFLGVPFNITSYSLLLHIICKITGYKPRFLHHIIGDAHIYHNHINLVEKQLRMVPYNFPELLIKNIDDIDNLNESMFEIKGYNSYNALKGNMIA